MAVQIDYKLEPQRRFGRIHGVTARIGKIRFIPIKDGVEIQGEGWKRILKNESFKYDPVTNEFVYAR